MFFIFQKICHFFTIQIVFTIFICIFFIPNSNLSTDLLWPSPGFYNINSNFGARTSPVKGSPSFHYGVDIGAPQGSTFVAVTSGTISYVGFLGGGGYTITLTDDNTENGEIKYSYCHCDPNFIVSVGEHVYKRQVIGSVGPKYVYGVKGNQYTDEDGNPTNGATTGPHLHFGIRINGEYVNPLDYIKH